MDQGGVIFVRGSIVHKASIVYHHQKGGECEVKTLHPIYFDEDKVQFK